MQQNFENSLNRLLVHEGGYTNHPKDPGGPTNFGITLEDYRLYVNAKATAADVRSMKKSEAVKIYDQKYWGRMRCSELPSGVDYSIFDYAVNSGYGRAGRVLRKVLGLPTTTWKVTDEVIAELAKRDPRAVIIAINDERLRFLMRLKIWPTFGNGWSRRVKEVKQVSLQMAAGSVPPVKLPPANVAAIPLGTDEDEINIDAELQNCGKGKEPEPKELKNSVKYGGTGLYALFCTVWGWVQAHPFESLVLGFLLLTLIAAIVIEINEAWRRRQDTVDNETPVVPELPQTTTLPATVSVQSLPAPQL